MSDKETLADVYVREQDRIRGLIVQYAALGPAGEFEKMMLEGVARGADAAAMSGDLPWMVRAYWDMKDCK